MDEEEINEETSSTNGGSYPPVESVTDADIQWKLNLQGCIINLYQTLVEALLSGKFPTMFLEPLMGAVTLIVDNMLGVDEELGNKVLEPNWSAIAGPEASDRVVAADGSLDLWTITEASALRDFSERNLQAGESNESEISRNPTVLGGLEAFTFMNAPKVQDALASVIIDNPEMMDSITSSFDLIVKASENGDEHFSNSLDHQSNTDLISKFYSFMMWLRMFGVPSAMAATVVRAAQNDDSFPEAMLTEFNSPEDGQTLSDDAEAAFTQLIRALLDLEDENEQEEE